MPHLSNFLFFAISLLYYYINLNSSITGCLFSGDIDLFFGISLLSSFDGNSFECNSFACSSIEDFFYVILSEMLLPIKSSVASAVFSIALFESGFSASIAEFLALPRYF